MLMLVFSSFGVDTNITVLSYKAGTNLVLGLLNQTQFSTNIPISIASNTIITNLTIVGSLTTTNINVSGLFYSNQFNASNNPITIQTNITVTNLTVSGTLTATNINGTTTNAVSIATTNNSGILIVTNGGSSFSISTNGSAGPGGSGSTVIVGGTGITSVSNNATNFTVSITSPITTTISDSALSTNVPRLNAANQHWNGPQLFDNGFSGTGSDIGAITAHIGTLTLTNALADSMLSTNIPLKNATQTWAGAQAFTNNGNTYNGTFNGTLGVTNPVSFVGGISQFGSQYQMNSNVTAAGNVKWFLLGNTNYQNTNQLSFDSSTICIDMNPYNSGSAWSVIPTTTNANYAFGLALSTNSSGTPIYQGFDDIGTSFVVTSVDSPIAGDLPGVAQIVRNAYGSSAFLPDTNNLNGRFSSRFALTSAAVIGAVPGNYSYFMTDPIGAKLHFPIWAAGKFTFDNTNAAAVFQDGLLIDYNTGSLNIFSNLNVGGDLRVTNGSMTEINGYFRSFNVITNADTNNYFFQGNVAYQAGNGGGMTAFQSQGANVLAFGSGNHFDFTAVSAGDGWFPFASVTIGDTELQSITNSSHAALEIHGGIATAYKNIATNYTPTMGDDFILVSATGKTITLPSISGNHFSAADGFASRHYTIKQIVSGGSTTIATTGGATIDGASTYVLTNQYSTVELQSDNTNWWRRSYIP